MKEGFHNPPQPLPKEFSSPFNRKVEGSRKDMAALGIGYFKQREASCKIKKESLNHYWIWQSKLINPIKEGVSYGHQQGALDCSAPETE